MVGSRLVEDVLENVVGLSFLSLTGGVHILDWLRRRGPVGFRVLLWCDKKHEKIVYLTPFLNFVSLFDLTPKICSFLISDIKYKFYAPCETFVTSISFYRLILVNVFRRTKVSLYILHEKRSNRHSLSRHDSSLSQSDSPEPYQAAATAQSSSS